ncbi:hypothetical protein [Actinoplanes sp. NPDC089786]|uniref:COG1470 family protein n=1 Tax=Actinoplanes sp. NPDC089786 TaxID=3155185 RepID=UPI0034224B17
MTTYAVLEQTPLEILPGNELTCALTVRNNSDVVEAYRFEVVGEVAQWTVLDPPELSVYPGTEQNVTVRFQPPRSFRVRPGEIPFAVRVLPAERPGDSVAPEGFITVGGFTETSAEITPRTSSARRNGKHEVAVDNRGNVPILATITGIDPDDQLKLRSRPERITIQPGSTEFVKVIARHRRRLWQGEPVTHPFQVEVAASALTEPPLPAEPPIMLDAGAVQTALIPRGARMLAFGLLALAVLAAGAWFLLLRPAVKSAAEEAVAQPLKEVAAKADSAGKKADDAKTKADTTEQVVANGGANGGAVKKPGDGEAVTTRLAPTTINLQTTQAASNTARTDSHTVGKRTTLVLTDLVLQNPQGDEGRVDVLVNGRAILTLSLANFRDLDYHFVTPFEVPAEKNLTLRTVCQKPGTPIVGATAGQCRTLMFATGTNKVRSGGGTAAAATTPN